MLYVYCAEGASVSRRLSKSALTPLTLREGYIKKELSVKLYVVSEIGTIMPSKILDTLKAMPLVSGGFIIVLSCF